MGINEMLIWFVILLAAIFLFALISLPQKNHGKKYLMLFVLNFVFHFLSIYFSEFAEQTINVQLNPFFAANYGPLLWLYFLNFKREKHAGTNPLIYFLPSFALLLLGLLRHLSFTEITIITGVILTLNFGFIVKCIALYFKSEDRYSNTEKKWLLLLVGLFGLLLTIVTANLVFSIAQNSSYQKKSITLVFILAAILVGVIIYFGIVAPELFKNFKHKYLGSGLSKTESLALAKQVESYLITNDNFIDSEISLEKIAAKLEITPKKVSQAINQHLADNFYDYINSLRIKKASKMLIDQANAQLPIKYIMYDSGFSNKVTFNKAFKSRLGVTPSDYRKKHLPK